MNRAFRITRIMLILGKLIANEIIRIRFRLFWLFTLEW